MSLGVGGPSVLAALEVAGVSIQCQGQTIRWPEPFVLSEACSLSLLSSHPTPLIQSSVMVMERNETLLCSSLSLEGTSLINAT